MQAPLYEFFVALSFVSFAGLWWMNLRARRSLRELELYQWLPLPILMGIAAVMGAWSMQSIVAWNPRQGGTALWGGLLSAYGFLLFLGPRLIGAKLARADFDTLVSASIPALGFSHALGRVACLSAECCYGRILTFGIVSLPAPVIEMEILFVALLAGYFQQQWRRGREAKKSFLFRYLVSYALGRFFLEFLRADPGRGSLLGLSSSQWLSLTLLLGAAIFLDFKRRTRDKSPL